MYVLINQLPDEVLILFKESEVCVGDTVKIKRIALKFIDYLIETTLKGIERKYIDIEGVFLEECCDIFENFISNADKIEYSMRKSLISKQQKENIYYESIYKSIVEQESFKERKLSAEELWEIENDYSNSLSSWTQEELLLERIYDACGHLLRVTEDTYMDYITFFRSEFEMLNEDVFEFYYNGRVFKIFNKNYDSFYDEEEYNDLPLLNLPSDYPVHGKKNRFWECHLTEPGHYIENFNIDISHINIYQINVNQIENINYIMLFLKKYLEEPMIDYLVCRNIAMLEKNINFKGDDFKVAYELLETLKTSSTEDKLSKMLIPKLKEELQQLAIEEQLWIGDSYIGELLNDEVLLLNEFHPKSLEAIRSQLEDTLKDNIHRSVDELYEALNSKNGDTLTFSIVDELINKNPQLFAVKPKSKIGKANYDYWKSLNTNKLSLLNVKMINGYGIKYGKGFYQNAHGVVIGKQEFRNYQSDVFRISSSMIFPLWFESREEAYEKLLSGSKFQRIRGYVDDCLHLEAKYVLNGTGNFMLNAFLSDDDFRECRDRLDVILNHLETIDIYNATVDDYFIDWSSLGDFT